MRIFRVPSAFVAALCVGITGLAQTPAISVENVQALTLSQAISEALDKNLELIASRYDVPIAQARLLTAELRPNPVMSFEAGHLIYPITPDFNKQNAAGPNEFAVRADFLLERGDKRQLRTEVAETSRSITELEVLNAARLVVQDVETAFVDILQAKSNLALAEENSRTFSDIVEVNRNRVRSGDLAEVELIRSEVAQLQFENTVHQARLQVRTSGFHLQLLLGRDVTQALADATGDMRHDLISEEPPALRAYAMEHRPDLLAVRKDQARSQADIRLQIAEGKVDYTIGGEYRRQQGASAYGNLLGFFFSANLPVFNRNQGEIARANEVKLQADARVRAMEMVVQNEVQVAYLQYQNALDSLSRIENSLLQRATDVRKITEYSYRRGEASFLEFVDAQKAYNETVQTYNDARGSFARSLYGIDAATGASTTAAQK